MGSFSINGYISHLPIIEGDKCFALIGLFDKNRLRDDICDRYSPIIPIALPIFGEYDDYGYLDNIKKDKNTKIIEEFFEIEIEKLINCKNNTDICKKFNNEELKISIIIDHEFIFREICDMNNFFDLEKAYQISTKSFDIFTKYYDKDYYDNTDLLTSAGYVGNNMFIEAKSCFELCCKEEIDYPYEYVPQIHPYFYNYNKDRYELFLYKRKDLSEYLMNNLKEDYLRFLNFNENSKFYGLKYLPNTSSSQFGQDDIPVIKNFMKSINDFIEKKKEL